MSGNYAIDFSIGFDTYEHLDMFDRTCGETVQTVGKNLGIDIDEVRVDPDPSDNRLQITGTSDSIPGKRAFVGLYELPGCESIELWYSGGDRDNGEVVWSFGDPRTIGHRYLPTEHKPDNDDMYSIAEAFNKHSVIEILDVEDLWE